MKLSRSPCTRLMFLLVLALPLRAQPALSQLSPVPKVDAKAIIIMDYARGEVLYEHNADEPIPPASLTKIMTMYVALDAVKAGRVGLDERITIRKEEATLPYGSSLMYLREGMHVPFDDLLRGMAVISGNDAAFTVARVLAGGNENFARLMNLAAERMGLGVTHFVEPSGLSEYNVSTARELAMLAREYIHSYPDALTSYHARYSMEFPRADVMPDGESAPAGKILLRNRNDLVFRYDGCDGLKTGYIDESGFNLIATAERNGTRFIIVTLGGTYGATSRERGGAMLLDWAFANWKTLRPQVPETEPVRVWGSSSKTVMAVPDGEVSFTIPIAYAKTVSVRVEQLVQAEAPLQKGDKLGTLIYSSENRVLARIPLVAASDAPKGNVFIRIGDAIAKFFARLFGKSDALQLSQRIYTNRFHSLVILL